MLASRGMPATDPARTPVIVDGLRTPFGRYGGALAGVRPDDMAAHVIRCLIERTGIDPAGIDDVILGCANQAGEDNRNVARMAALLAGLPVSVPGADGQPAVRLAACRRCRRAAHRSRPATADFVAGGVEQMTRAPFVMAKPSAAFPRGDADAVRHDPRLALHEPAPGRGALPVQHGRDGRERRRAVRREPRGAGRVRARVAAALARPPWTRAASRDEIVADRGAGSEARRDDQVERRRAPAPRHDRSRSSRRLKPAFRASDRHRHGGQRRGINDGAAALLVDERGRARASSASGRWRACVASAVAGVDPATMGLGPIPAAQQGARAGRADGRRHRSGRAERGVRGAGDPRACASWASTRRR